MTRKNVLVFRELPDDQMARLRAAHEVTVANPKRADQRKAFDAALPTAHGLIGASYSIDETVLARAPRLEAVSSISVGVDNYDLPALRQRGIVLTHTPGVLTETTADTLFALLIASSRRIVELANHVRDGQWTHNIDESLFGWDVHGKTVGILGFGRIGQAVARRAALGFGMPVLYHHRREVECPGLEGHVKAVSMEALLAESDFIVLALPLTEETRGLMNASRFAAMKRGAILINGSRGAVVDEEALLAALDHGHLRAAGLDVFAVEPLPQASPLRRHPRVTALPHIGSATHETRYAMAVLATDNLLQELAGERSECRVP
ncbi:bifunctional glyoxylate/hydroxypyruvate reductase B [Hydrogenophaga crassostreae]|uniref:Glyoxylate/hydroxypyruvate reductase B n=1 Tax=Hydrogenophaga crassostreae TaxID=1763535 RepID=A0A163C709_9BURK|nr:D-glycerate dehydrogenase [Hydrogenophaga crassostreae]AOW11704.1 bifunctional glyoxylate/hydroxypyruvate reductase B [Hydrogenophaga crassostreae]OAD39796.1 bifunctional glyoxylate/hydroxypyruvate reductase B [Hydrogenophaga crassostreae]